MEIGQDDDFFVVDGNERLAKYNKWCSLRHKGIGTHEGKGMQTSDADAQYCERQV